MKNEHRHETWGGGVGEAVLGVDVPDMGRSSYKRVKQWDMLARGAPMAYIPRETCIYPSFGLTWNFFLTMKELAHFDPNFWCVFGVTLEIWGKFGVTPNSPQISVVNLGLPQNSGVHPKFI